MDGWRVFAPLTDGSQICISHKSTTPGQRDAFRLCYYYYLTRDDSADCDSNYADYTINAAKIAKFILTTANDSHHPDKKLNNSKSLTCIINFIQNKFIKNTIFLSYG